MNYEDDMRIDEEALDIEWLEQASKAMQYGKHWADCVRDVARAEEGLKLLVAKLTKEANSNPERCLGDGVKPTGANVEAYYISHPDYIEAKEELIEMQHKTNVADLARREISHTRKLALENLVRLHGQQYFAGPIIPRDLTEEREKREQHMHRKMVRKRSE